MVAETYIFRVCGCHIKSIESTRFRNHRICDLNFQIFVKFTINNNLWFKVLFITNEKYLASTNYSRFIDGY